MTLHHLTPTQDAARASPPTRALTRDPRRKLVLGGRASGSGHETRRGCDFKPRLHPLALGVDWRRDDRPQSPAEESGATRQVGDGKLEIDTWEKADAINRKQGQKRRGEVKARWPRGRARMEHRWVPGVGPRDGPGVARRPRRLSTRLACSLLASVLADGRSLQPVLIPAGPATTARTPEKGCPYDRHPTVVSPSRWTRRLRRGQCGIVQRSLEVSRKTGETTVPL